ncbi:hemicentin-1-like [Chelmon rostratus]|uniref:hemicentin-1-like n=1 Tax=Chelmon rostratus TaxID=109905 RepID=UPI001BEC8713|nr:hemicentin-1-like [Chelmon rostratus]
MRLTVIKHLIRMCALIWTTLLFAVRINNAYTATASPRETPKITPEAGLCVEIRCYSTTDFGFTVVSTVGYKCEHNCTDSDIILRLKNTSAHAQSGFGVSLLDRNLSQTNCIIIITDLTKSDSGSYQLTVLNGRTQGSTSHETFSETDLFQKPTVRIPPLTEGQQTTLTCTAPCLCSGSDPEVTWMWRRTGENGSHITGNVTAFKTDNLTVTQRCRSTLTFHPSVMHHGTEVVCMVSFTGGMTTEETVTLNVNYVKKPEISGMTTVKEGDSLNLTCSVASFPPYAITWAKLGLNEILNDETGTDLHSDAGTAGTLVIPNMTAEYSGQYICTAKLLNNTLTAEVNVTVIHVKKSEITGKRTLKEGDTLNLTCNVEDFLPSLVMWTKVPSNKNLQSRTETDLQNNTGTATLVIPNVTPDHAGQYNCTAKHLNMTVSIYAIVTVTSYPKILNSSGCISQSKALTCMCISQWFPLPTIKWPLIENHTEYSVITTVSNHTINSTITLTAKEQTYTVVECVSRSENGEVKENLIITKAEEDDDEDQYVKLLRTVTQLEVVIAFLIGALLSAIFCCLVRQCPRKRQRTHENLAETLEMVTSHKESLVDAGQEVEDDQAFLQEAAEAGEAVSVGKPDVEYSNLDFSLIKTQSPAEAGMTQETTETEYAEIKKEKAEAEQGGEGRAEEEVMEGDEEKKQSGPDQEEGEEDVALYSTVKDIMDQI